MTKHMNLLVGGPRAAWPDDLLQGRLAGEFIGVDRGTLRLLELGYRPVAAIGDFDSLQADELARVKTAISDIRQSKPEKDQTDTELAITVAFEDYQAETVTVYGATGGRLDHLLANLLLVLAPRYRQRADRIQIIDQQNSVRFFLPGSYVVHKEPDKDYLAFVPLTAVDHLTLVDEKYQLTDQPVPYPISYASNEFVGDEAHFRFDSGVMAVIQSRDTYEARHE